MGESTSSTWPDESGPSSQVIARYGRPAAASGLEPRPRHRVTDSRVDEQLVPWVPSDDDSDEQGQMCLTLARADSSDGDARWRPLGESVRLASGKRVPGTRYRIVRWLGEGGMGMVFEAVHVDIQRPVALKILKPGVAEAEDQRERFIEEARAVAQVESRFVVDVLDFGELPDGRPFYTMELLDPVSLHDELRDGPMPLERALPILRQCCKALAAVHARGLAHRDVKPQNVLIQVEDGRTDAVRVVDFGIAAAFDSRPRVAGTALYMAPEQIRGVGFDGRVDIYALGCVAYELLTGTAPYVGTSAADIVQQHLDSEPIPARERLASLPPAIDAVVSKCLAKHPDERYASMHELEAALCEVQIAVGFTTPWDDLPLPAIPDAARTELAQRMPRPRSQRRRFGRHLRLVVGAFAIGLLSAVGLMSVDARPVPSNTELSAATSGIEAKVADARVAASRAYWAYPPADQPDYPTALRMIGALEDERGALQYFAWARAAELRDEFAQTLVRLGDQYWSAPNGRPFAAEYYAQALLFDVSHPRARERTSLTPAQLGDASARALAGKLSPVELEIGEVLRALADPDPAHRRERVVELLTNPLLMSASTWLRMRSQLAALVGSPELAPASPNLQPEQSEPTAEQAQARPSPRERRGHKQDRGHATPEREAQAYTRQAAKLLARGDRAQAEILFSNALEIDPQLGDAHAGLAEIHFARGRYERARSAARRAAKTLTEDAALQLLLGDSCVKTDRLDEAREAYERARALGHDKAAQRLRQLDELAPTPGASP